MVIKIKWINWKVSFQFFISRGIENYKFRSLGSDDPTHNLSQNLILSLFVYFVVHISMFFCVFAVLFYVLKSYRKSFVQGWHPDQNKVKRIDLVALIYFGRVSYIWMYVSNVDRYYTTGGAVVFMLVEVVVYLDITLSMRLV